MRYLILLFVLSLSVQAQSHWKIHVIDNSSSGADRVKLADINNDGRLDIVTGWEEGGVTKLYLQSETKSVKEKGSAVIVGKSPNVEDVKNNLTSYDYNMLKEQLTRQRYLAFASKLHLEVLLRYRIEKLNASEKGIENRQKLEEYLKLIEKRVM